MRRAQFLIFLKRVPEIAVSAKRAGEGVGKLMHLGLCGTGISHAGPIIDIETGCTYVNLVNQ